MLQDDRLSGRDASKANIHQAPMAILWHLHMEDLMTEAFQLHLDATFQVLRTDQAKELVATAGC